MDELGKVTKPGSGGRAADSDETTDHAGEEVLDTQLQTYARKVAMICALEAGGKVTALEAYRRIKSEWKRLKSLKKEIFPKDKATG
jgi:hypothetical protein